MTISTYGKVARHMLFYYLLHPLTEEPWLFDSLARTFVTVSFLDYTHMFFSHSLSPIASVYIIAMTCLY